MAVGHPSCTREQAWAYARRFLRDLPIWCVLGSTVRVDEMLQPSQVWVYGYMGAKTKGGMV